MRHSGSVSAQRRGLHLYSWIMRRGPRRPLGGAARGAAKTRNCAQNISLRHVCEAARRDVGRRLSCVCARKEAGGAAEYYSPEYFTAAKNKQKEKKKVCLMLKRMRLAAAAAAAPPNLGVTVNANSRLSSGTNDQIFINSIRVLCVLLRDIKHDSFPMMHRDHERNLWRHLLLSDLLLPLRRKKIAAIYWCQTTGKKESPVLQKKKNKQMGQFEATLFRVHAATCCCRRRSFGRKVSLQAHRHRVGEKQQQQQQQHELCVHVVAPLRSRSGPLLALPQLSKSPI